MAGGKDLVTLPDVAMRIARMVNDPTASASDIGREIGRVANEKLGPVAQLFGRRIPEHDQSPGHRAEFIATLHAAHRRCKLPTS